MKGEDNVKKFNSCIERGGIRLVVPKRGNLKRTNKSKTHNYFNSHK